MQLTRRDALAALTAAGAVGAGAVAADQLGAGSDPGPETLAVTTAAAEVLYPSQVEGHREFVKTYVIGRVTGRPSYKEGLDATALDLDEIAREWFDEPFSELPREDRDAVLRQVGAATANPDADGTLAERVRHYLVNDLLFALYSSPTGGELVGTENPIGYPGGYRTVLSPDNHRADDDGDPTNE